MRSTIQIALAAIVACACLALRPALVTAATPLTTAVYRASSDAAVEATPVRYYRPYGVYYRPYAVYRPYVYRPYVYRPYVYRTYAYPYYAPAYPTYAYPYYGGGYYRGPGFYFGYRW